MTKAKGTRKSEDAAKSNQKQPKRRGKEKKEKMAKNQPETARTGQIWARVWPKAKRGFQRWPKMATSG